MSPRIDAQNNTKLLASASQQQKITLKKEMFAERQVDYSCSKQKMMSFKGYAS